MERAAWTEERLDDLAEAMRGGFVRIDQDVRDLRSEMREEFRSVRGEIGTLRGEMGVELRSVRDEISALRLTIMRIGGVGFFGVIAAILARGV